ncbi:MAG: histidine--tRNA ligase [Conexivisphaerales archaeon]
MKPLRGIKDYSPEEFERLEGLREIFVELSKLYGFKLMEPAPLEPIETLEEKSGPGIRDEIYNFKDKGDREIGLRFDLTVGLTRYACFDRAAALPIRLGSFGGVFRYDEPQHARYRWFYQWDVETYGSANPEADAEMIEFTSHLLRKAGVREHVVKIGDRRLVQEFIEKKLGFTGDRAVELMRALDKIDKKTRTELEEEYGAKGFSEDAIDHLLDFGALEGSPSEVMSKLQEESLESASGLAELLDELSGGHAKIGLSVKIVRGIDYYTSTVYEAFDLKDPSLGALAGGGRYDLLPSIFGRKDLPATGVAGGAERLMISLEKGRSQGAASARPVYVAAAGGLVREALAVAAELREQGVATVTDLQRRTLARQLQESARANASKVVIVGPAEYSHGKLVVRDMDTRKEERVKREELLGSL